jgi:hypothetical protein
VPNSRNERQRALVTDNADSVKTLLGFFIGAAMSFMGVR